VNKKFIIKLSILIITIAAILIFILPDYRIILSELDTKEYTHIRIFHTNDLHGSIRENLVNKIMGMARVEYLVKQNLLSNGNNILLDAGDTIWGSNETDLNNGKPMVEIMNLMGYKAMTVGNHEFDFGQEKTEGALESAEFPVISATIFKNNKRLFPPFTIIETGGIKLGIIGYSTTDTINRTKPEYVADLKIDVSKENIESVIKELKPQCDFIIFLAHIHKEVLKKLVDDIDDIGLAIIGHEHITFPGLDKYNKTYVTSAGCYSLNLGIVDMVFKKKTAVYMHGCMLNTLGKRAKEEKINTIVENYYQKIIKRLDIKIGETSGDLTDPVKARIQETNFGNVITDAMREYMKTDIALQNGGGIRVTIPKGDITLYNIHEAFPFINYVIQVEMTGKQIKEALEHGVEIYPSGWNGGFLQVSGIEYAFNGAAPAGKRLMFAKTGGKDIEDQKTYSIATNDYLYQGGDGYDVIKNSRFVYNSGLLIEDIFKEYILKHKIIDPGLEGRIIIKNPKT
jgi:5'-nucleotidase/UDP-sugar diphosphatase